MGGEVGLGAVGGEGHAVELLGQAAAVGVVDVDDRRLRAHLEQQPLGAEVVLHRAVEVEVVLGEVGEEGHLEVDRVAAVQGQRVRGDLHRAGPVSRLQHPPEGRLQVDRLRSRPLDLLLHPADHLPHRPQQPALDPSRLEHLPDQERRGRLPVRPRDPHNPQLRRRIPPEPSRQRRHSRPRIGHNHLRHVQIQLPLDHKPHRPGLNGGRPQTHAHRPSPPARRRTASQAQLFDCHKQEPQPRRRRPPRSGPPESSATSASNLTPPILGRPPGAPPGLKSTRSAGSRRAFWGGAPGGPPPIQAAPRDKATQTPRSSRTPGRQPTRRRCPPAAGRRSPTPAAAGPAPAQSR